MESTNKTNAIRIYKVKKRFRLKKTNWNKWEVNNEKKKNLFNFSLKYDNDKVKVNQLEVKKTPKKNISLSEYRADQELTELEKKYYDQTLLNDLDGRHKCSREDKENIYKNYLKL